MREETLLDAAVIDDQHEGTGRIRPVERVPASPAIRDPFWRAAPVLSLAGEPAVENRPLLIRAALARPTLPGAMVPRPRRVSQLEPTPACRLALVVAPAGAGKSSLLSEWCNAHPGARIAWISLDANDNEPIRFLLSLSAALERVAPEVAEP